MKLTIFALGLFSFQALASSCLDSYVSNRDHLYTPLAICDEVVSSNVDGDAFLSLSRAEICIVKDENLKGVFRKTSVLIGGPIFARFLTGETGTVTGGLYATVRIKDQVPTVIRAEQRYLGKTEVDVFDAEKGTLTTKVVADTGKIELYAILSCRKL